MKLSKNSLKRLKSLKPALARLVRRAAQIAGDDEELDFVIVQGNRTQAYQNKLYEIGRRGIKDERKVTWTRNSKHIGGGAIDFAALDALGKITWNAQRYPAIAKVFYKAARELGTKIKWGGEWRSKDWGHIQLEPGRGRVPPIKVPAPKVLRLRSSGPQVKELQALLKAVGFEVGKIDGIFGHKTQHAVKHFQKSG